MILEMASLNGFFKTVLILLLIYFLFKFAIRLFAPILVHKVARKAEESFRQAYQQKQPEQSQDINKQFSKNKFPKEKRKVGEYIDYEEIE